MPFIIKPAIQERYIVRFDRHQRIQHLLLMITFLLLVFTGMPLKFNDWSISQWWIELWGGIDNTRVIHRDAGWTMILTSVYHLAYIAYTTFILKRPFPIQMVPSRKDLDDIIQEMGYFLGLKKQRPRFDRFDWRQKFDYWAVFWGMPVMFISGFILAYPVFATDYLPSWSVPVALIAHSDEALLATTWIFVVHFIFIHLAPGVFPLNKVIFTGKLSDKQYHHEHPMEYERMTAVPVSDKAYPTEPLPVEVQIKSEAVLDNNEDKEEDQH